MQAQYSEKLVLHGRGYYINDYHRLFPGHPKGAGKGEGERRGGRKRDRTLRVGVVCVNRA